MRKLLLITPLLFVIVLLFDGRVPSRGCDFFLGLEWSLATLRTDDDGMAVRPTVEEATKLKGLIRVCKPFKTTINLWSPLDGDFSLWRDVNFWGDVALITLAVELDDVEFIEQLVDDGHPIDGLPNSLGITTLTFATYRQSQNVFRWLLVQGVDPNVADSQGAVPLLTAATQDQNKFPSIQLLLDAGANPDVVLPNGGTPLAAAIQRNLHQNASQLIDAGASAEQATGFLVDWAENGWGEDGQADILRAVESFQNYTKTREIE